MHKKRIRMKRVDIYAIYYQSSNTIYYNLDFKGLTQIIVFMN